MYFSTRSTPPVAGEISLLFSVLFFCFPDAQEVTSLVQECYYKKLICFQKKKGQFFCRRLRQEPHRRINSIFHLPSLPVMCSGQVFEKKHVSFRWAVG
jgi:hypothetical protein